MILWRFIIMVWIWFIYRSLSVSFPWFFLCCFLFVIASMARIDGFAGNCLPPLLIRLHANEVQRHVVAPRRNTMARSTNWNVQNNVAWKIRMNLLFSFARYIIPLQQIRRTCPKLSTCLLLCWVYDSFPGQYPARVPGRIFVAPTLATIQAMPSKNNQVFLWFFLHIMLEYLSISHLQNKKQLISAYFLTSSSHNIPIGF